MLNLSKGIVADEGNGRLVVLLNTHIYQKEAITLASYKFIDKCYVLIEPVDESIIRVCVESKEGAVSDLKSIALDFCNEVLDQQVRIQLEQSYGPIREKIVEQAFSPIAKSKSQS